MTKTVLSLIAAVGRNSVIGQDNAMPWRLPSDLKRFKALTLGHPIVMGRRTFESIGRPLPGRDNIVVSRGAFRAAGVTAVASIEAALAEGATKAGAGGEVFVIGGGQLYAETIGIADRLYITEVDAAPKGDSHFPAINPAEWREVRRDAPATADGDSAAAALVVYERRGKTGQLKPDPWDPT